MTYEKSQPYSNVTHCAMADVDVIALLLLLSNDVERNPGPKSRRSESQPAKTNSKSDMAADKQTNRKFDMLEKHLTKLEKELLATRRMGNVITDQSSYLYRGWFPLIQAATSQKIDTFEIS